MMKECLHIRNFHLCSGKLLSYEFHNFKRLFQPTLLRLDWGIFCRHCLAAALCWVAGVVKPAPKHDANCPEVGEFSKFSFEIFGKSNDIFLVKLTRRHSRRYFQSQGHKIVIKNHKILSNRRHNVRIRSVLIISARLYCSLGGIILSSRYSL